MSKMNFSSPRYPRRDLSDLEVPNYLVPQKSYVDSDAYLGINNEAGPKYDYSIEDGVLRILAAPYTFNEGVLRIS